jgi:riboflavin synthase
MFTGLVSDVGRIVSIEDRGELKRVRIACAYAADSIALGASIACSGPCLTAVDRGVDANGQNWFEVDVGAETQARTTGRNWRVGTRINLERSLRICDELGGHLVSGHVDGVARILARRDFDGMAHFDVRAPKDLAKFIAEKGSVSLDGTSLTVNGVSGEDFTILLIPHTLAVTTWGERKAGDELNIEVDQMARYAARLAEARS